MSPPTPAGRTPRRSAARSPRDERIVAIVLFPGVALLDVAAPLQVLGRLGRPFRIVLVAERMGPVTSDTPVTLSPHAVFAGVSEPAVLIVPGGGLGLVRALVDDGVTSYVAAVGARGGLVGAACTGSLLLAAAGALRGRRATTHWGYAALLERLGAHYTAERVTEDGPIVTASGGTAVVDMALRLAARLAGDAEARRIATSLSISGATGSTRGPGRAADRLLGHLPRAEAVARLASMRLILAGRPELLERLGV